MIRVPAVRDGSFATNLSLVTVCRPASTVEKILRPAAGDRRNSSLRRNHMLVLSRQSDETIIIGDNIRVTIVEVRGDKVRIGIDAPRDVAVHRQEIFDAIRKESQAPGKAG
jgi:carbon storage regulator